MRWDYLKLQQGGDAMLPSYSVRRGRLTAQLTCRTWTSYTPVKHSFKYFYLIYSLFTNSVYAPILNDLVGRTRQRLAVPVISERLGVVLASNNKRWRITQNHHASHHTSHHTSSAHLCALCALCVPFFALLATTLCARRDGVHPSLNSDTNLVIPCLH